MRDVYNFSRFSVASKWIMSDYLMNLPIQNDTPEFVARRLLTQYFHIPADKHTVA